MKVFEVNQILDNENMQDKETNFKVYKNGKNQITVNELYDEFKDFKKIVLSFIADQQKFNQDQQKFNQDQQKFNQDQQKFNQDQQKFNQDQQKFNQLIVERLDNLVKKNNLKE